MRSLLAPCLLCANLLLPASLLAQPLAEAPPAAPPTDRVRPRFGVAGNIAGGGLTRTNDPNLDGNVFSAGIGVTLDFGVQINDRLAVYGHGLLSTSLITNLAALSGVVEYSPTPEFSLGAGVGWMGLAVVNPLRHGGSEDPSWGGLSIPLIAAINLGGRQPSGRVAAFRLGVEGALGLSPGTDDVAFYTSLNIGYVSM